MSEFNPNFQTTLSFVQYCLEVYPHRNLSNCGQPDPNLAYPLKVDAALMRVLDANAQEVNGHLPMQMLSEITDALNTLDLAQTGDLDTDVAHTLQCLCLALSPPSDTPETDTGDDRCDTSDS